MELLIDAGADVNQCYEGMSALDLADDAEAQQLLRRHGARSRDRGFGTWPRWMRFLRK